MSSVSGQDISNNHRVEKKFFNTNTAIGYLKKKQQRM